MGVLFPGSVAVREGGLWLLSHDHAALTLSACTPSSLPLSVLRWWWSRWVEWFDLQACCGHLDGSPACGRWKSFCGNLIPQAERRGRTCSVKGCFGCQGDR